MAEGLAIAGSIAGLVTLVTSTSPLLAGISSAQKRRLAASLEDLMPVLLSTLDTLDAHQHRPTAAEIQPLVRPVVKLYTALHQLDRALQDPVHLWERRGRREVVKELLSEIERAKSTMILAFGLVNWRALETMKVDVATVLEGQQRLAAGGNVGAIGNCMLMRKGTRYRIEKASFETITIMAEINDINAGGNVGAVGNGVLMRDETRYRVSGAAIEGTLTAEINGIWAAIGGTMTVEFNIDDTVCFAAGDITPVEETTQDYTDERFIATFKSILRKFVTVRIVLPTARCIAVPVRAAVASFSGL
ncbi:hypothetical protein EDC01DRAFT_647115 [Geopyxis carbonaria]|nr:hypothetical protein EDC01DRAFT_647115 [Geopyxis carbonaria]